MNASNGMLKNVQPVSVCQKRRFYKWGGYIYTNKWIANTIKQEKINTISYFYACK